ncbi:MAG: MFS transporter [Dehalococcoidia bacterium]|nr:MFS transporter [Dehalococcoidia bacterium]
MARTNTEIAVQPRPRLFYGWVIVGVVFTASLVGAASGFDMLAVLLKPMSESLGLSRTAALLPATIATGVSAVAGFFLGPLVDRYGPRRVMVACSLLGVGVLLLLSRMSAAWQFYVLFGLGIGILRPGLWGLPGMSALAHWFIRRRGRATALASAGMGVSALVMIPIGQAVASAFGWRAVWLMLAVMMLALVVPAAAFFMRGRPEEMGLRADGEAPAAPGGTAGALPADQVNRGEDWQAREAVRTRAFWLIAVAFGLSMLPVGGLWLHALAFFTDGGLSPTQASFAMAATALGTLPGRLVWGIIGERVPSRWCILISTAATGAMLLLIMSAHHPLTATLAMALWGLAQAGLIQQQMQVWPDYFGRRHIATITGRALPVQMLGSAAGPLLAARMYDVSGSYTITFIVFMAAHALGAVAIFFAKPPRRAAPAGTA